MSGQGEGLLREPVGAVHALVCAAPRNDPPGGFLLVDLADHSVEVAVLPYVAVSCSIPSLVIVRYRMSPAAARD